MHFPADRPIHTFDAPSNLVLMSGAMLLLLDLFVLYMTAVASGNLHDGGLIAVTLAPFTLYDQRFGAAARRIDFATRTLLRKHVLRFTAFAGLVLLLGVLCHAFDHSRADRLAYWFIVSLGLTAGTRLLLVQLVRHLQHRGELAEVIAVVGAGPMADQLVETLQRLRPKTIELLGVFDDRCGRDEHSACRPIGNLEHLIELGKQRRIDWILLSLPPSAGPRIQLIVRRLKALSIPIGICPQPMAMPLEQHITDHVVDSVPVSVLGAQREERLLPRWIVTLALLPLVAVRARSPKGR